MDLEGKLDNLIEYRQKHFDLGVRVWEADSGKLFPVDILITAALNRSVCILKAFVFLIEHKNIVAAAPLIRLQLDNCMRLFAGTLVSDPHTFTIKILEGVHVRRQKDRSGRYMTDRYLVEKLSNSYPWAKSVYEETSGYIHLSEKHFFNAMRSDDENATVSLKISDEDAFIPDEIYDEAISAFQAATEAVFDLVDGWILTKDNPEVAAKLLADHLKKFKAG